MASRTRLRLFLFLLVCALAVASFTAHWWLVGRHYQSTSNAYVHAEISRVGSQLAAQVMEVLVDDNQLVEAGQLLVRLDDRDFRLARQLAEASLQTRLAEQQQVRARLAQQDSRLAAARAEIDAQQAELQRLQRDLARLTPLRQSGYASEEQLSHLQAQQQVVRARLRAAEAELRTRELDNNGLQAELQRLAALETAARAEIERAELAIERSEIRAAVAGRIGQRSVRVGQQVQVGQQLLALVPEQQLWVQANFKETQIRRLRPGQRVRLQFDAFPDEPLDGVVDSLFPATGAQFSLLPPDNATGNFTKVVQRLPVKILIDPQHPLRPLIRPGLSVQVRVDLRD